MVGPDRLDLQDLQGRPVLRAQRALQGSLAPPVLPEFPVLPVLLEVPVLPVLRGALVRPALQAPRAPLVRLGLRVPPALRATLVRRVHQVRRDYRQRFTETGLTAR
jgi:hypothetical protein